MRFNHLKSLYLSGIVFLLLLAIGFLLSERKLLWNDELYSQQTAITVDSYADILSFKFPDGNKNPLFYIIQKTVCNIFSLHKLAISPHHLRPTRDIPAQIIMRIPSNIYISLALSLIFYFFSRFYSVFIAFYALGVALVSPMVWMYWVEARPYPLWFLLTTIQLLLLYCRRIAPEIEIVKPLLLVHLLLAFTSSASMIQISIAFLILLCWKGKYNKMQLGLICAVPIGIALFYNFFNLSFKIKTYLFSSNLFDAVMPERLFVYVIYALTAWALPKKYKTSSGNIFFLLIFLLFLASGLFILLMDLNTKNSDFGFFSRYLIYIAPADILMYSLASFDLFQWSRKNTWIYINVSIFLGGLVIMRGLMTYRAILGEATYLHVPG